MQHLNGIWARQRTRLVWRWVAALFFTLAGVNHFLNPDFYRQLVPPGFPSPKMLVIVSGFGEMAGGLGLLIPPVRRLAGWGLIALLIAVFPANLYMAAHPERFGISPWLSWGRLPFQAVFVAWVWWIALWRSPEERRPTGTPQ